MARGAPRQLELRKNPLNLIRLIPAQGSWSLHQPFPVCEPTALL